MIHSIQRNYKLNKDLSDLEFKNHIHSSVIYHILKLSISSIKRREFGLSISYSMQLIFISADTKNQPP